jgi:hypothetical protein
MRRNCEGTDFLPMRLATVMIVASIVLVFASDSAIRAAGQMAKDSARDGAAHVAAVAICEYTEGSTGQGEGSTVTLAVPGCVRNVTFGLSSGEAYAIYYTDGSYEIRFQGVPVGSGKSGPDYGMPLVLGPGNHKIRVFAGEAGGRPMALLLEEAG